jgi:hypothetical protein
MENEDYFHLTRERLASAEDSAMDAIRSLTIPPTGILVLTESGYLLLVKSLTDELAWQVQRELVKGYFQALGQNTSPLAPEATLLPAEQQILAELVRGRAEGYGALQGKVLAELWSRLHNKFRVARYQQLPRSQLAEAIRYVMTAQIRTAPQPESTLPETPPRESSHSSGLPAAPLDFAQLEQALRAYGRFRRAQRAFICQERREAALLAVKHGWAALKTWVSCLTHRGAPGGKDP